MHSTTASARESGGSTVVMVANDLADRARPWTAVQDAVLSDAGLAAARAAISQWPGHAATPLMALPSLAADAGVASLHYKDEAHRFGLGSFKALGGAYAVARVLLARAAAAGQLMDMDDLTSGRAATFARTVTVTCATDGNHGRSVAWGARRFGARAVIFIHSTVSEGRRAAIAGFGAEVRRTPGTYDDSVRIAAETAAAEGWTVVSDTSYPGYTEIPRDVMQGYEVMAAEAFEALPEPPTHLFLQTGVGGMAAACTALAKRRWGDRRPRIILADPDRAACWVESFRAGAPTPVHGDLDTLMAGLACGEVSMLAWEVLRDHADAAVAVPDALAVAAMGRLARPAPGEPPVVAGESAVAGLAALLALDPAQRAALGLGPDSRVLVFGTEGDTDPDLYTHLVGMDAATVRSQAR